MSIRNLTLTEQKEARHLTECKDVTAIRGLENLIHALMRRYGTGYDAIKTLSIINEGLDRDWETLKEVK